MYVIRGLRESISNLHWLCLQEKKKNRKQLPLQNIGDSFKKIIIVKDGPTHYNESGILILNLFDFLLKENSLEC